MAKQVKQIKIRIQAGAPVMQGEKAFTTRRELVKDATPLKNNRGMTTGYSVTINDRPAYVSGYYATPLPDDEGE